MAVAFLKVVRDPNFGKVYEITGERVVFGRNPLCVVVLQGAGVSRRPAQILKREGQYFIEDLRSRNGTYVNNVEIQNRIQLHRRPDYILRLHISILHVFAGGKHVGRSVCFGRARGSGRSAAQSDWHRVTDQGSVDRGQEFGYIRHFLDRCGIVGTAPHQR